MPPPTDSNISDAQLRQMMLGFDQPGTATPPIPGMPSPPPGMEDDPMMRMMMQMLGGGAGAGAGGGNNPFGGAGIPGMPGMPFPPSTTTPPQPAAAVAAANRHAALWRLLHALIALALGLYIAVYTPFTGTKLSRDSAAAAAAGSAEARAELGGASPTTQNFFWAFATAEALLLGTRHLVVDRGRSRLGAAAAGGSGMLGMVVGFLPPGLRAKVEMAMRYGEVLGSVRADVLVCVFVLGVAAWVRS